MSDALLLPRDDERAAPEPEEHYKALVAFLQEHGLRVVTLKCGTKVVALGSALQPTIPEGWVRAEVPVLAAAALLNDSRVLAACRRRLRFVCFVMDELWPLLPPNVRALCHLAMEECVMQCFYSYPTPDEGGVRPPRPPVVINDGDGSFRVVDRAVKTHDRDAVYTTADAVAYVAKLPATVLHLPAHEELAVPEAFGARAVGAELNEATGGWRAVVGRPIGHDGARVRSVADHVQDDVRRAEHALHEYKLETKERGRKPPEQRRPGTRKLQKAVAELELCSAADPDALVAELDAAPRPVSLHYVMTAQAVFYAKHQKVIDALIEAADGDRPNAAFHAVHATDAAAAFRRDHPARHVSVAVPANTKARCFYHAEKRPACVGAEGNLLAKDTMRWCATCFPPRLGPGKATGVQVLCPPCFAVEHGLAPPVHPVQAHLAMRGVHMPACAFRR